MVIKFIIAAATAFEHRLQAIVTQLLRNITPIFINLKYNMMCLHEEIPAFVNAATS